MTKQKRGFWLFIFSLIPGAGEMYMGFRKQGISIMLLFWGIIALASGLNIGWFIMFLPILWFYSFFNVHNLKSLSPEEFYSLEDSYILNLDAILGDGDLFLKKYRVLIGAGMIILGGCVIWNLFMDFLYVILPYPLNTLASTLSYRLPQALLALGIILLGFYIIRGKQKNLTGSSAPESTRDPYWASYRSTQQSQKPFSSPMEDPFQPRDAFHQEEPASEEASTMEQPQVMASQPTPSPEISPQSETAEEEQQPE